MHVKIRDASGPLRATRCDVVSSIQSFSQVESVAYLEWMNVGKAINIPTQGQPLVLKFAEPLYYVSAVTLGSENRNSRSKPCSWRPVINLPYSGIVSLCTKFSPLITHQASGTERRILWELEREIITISVFLAEQDPRFFLYDLSSLNRLEWQAALVLALQSEINKESTIKGP